LTILPWKLTEIMVASLLSFPDPQWDGQYEYVGTTFRASVPSAAMWFPPTIGSKLAKP